VYAATVEGQRLTFDVRGVWRRNMIMRDRETGSLWQHATGEALLGPLEGRQLEMLGGAYTTWSGWKDQAPHTELGTAHDPPREGLFGNARLNRVLPLTERFLTPGSRRLDARLPAHEDLAGIRNRGAARAYPVSALRGAGLINEQLGDEPIAVFHDEASDRVFAFKRPSDLELTLDGPSVVAGGRRWTRAGRPTAGTEVPLLPLIVERQWWLGWSEHHPGTTVFNSTESQRA
jgi:Protein of unknown function (DUF3179)